MSIRKGLTWDPNTKKFYGLVDCDLDVNSDSIDEASQSLVLLLTCINGAWKLPIGYFLIVSLSGEQKATLVQTALQLCGDAGVKVVSITCDGLAGNFSMFSYLGCNILKDQGVTHFKSNNSVVHIFVDPCHAIKLVRNAFGELRVFTDRMGREINYKYLEFFLELQEDKGLHLATKIVQFRAVYKKLLIRAEIREGGVFENCIPLRQINILTCSSTNPLTSINQLSQTSEFAEIPEDDSDPYDTYIEYLGCIGQTDEYTQSVLEYISGFVTRKLSRQIKCEMCLALLIGDENLRSLISKKTRGGLKHASSGVIEIVNKTEKLIKPNIKNQNKPENYYLYIFRFLTECYETGNILYVPDNADHNASHRLLLIKSIILSVAKNK
ncbi:unnamed protein product [Euphydryas editha]|uniref:THAP domain-containing protein 9 n=1 Tax=Euphydryas editha TaxID=104508 RepID=A0AAU9TKE0_EUPED|nr:unnamed protein product [Euphydryas editha]